MQIDLPAEAIERANRLAAANEDAATVFVKALDTLEWQAAEVAAVREGMAAYEAGDFEPWDDFASRFMAERGIVPER